MTRSLHFRGEPIEARALRAIGEDLPGCPEDCWRFFENVWRTDAPHKMKALAWDLAVHPSTLITRFRRAGLPRPKLYVSWSLAVRAMWMLEDTSVSQLAAGLRLGFSTGQGFEYSMTLLLGMTVGQARQQYTGAALLEHYRASLILPYRETLIGFSPVIGSQRRAA